jgi:hypothetical protein
MAVFYSFHFSQDAWRVQQIINMGVLKSQTILNPQKWEDVKRKGRGTMGDCIPVYTPNGSTSQQVYNSMKANLREWSDNGYNRS